MPKFIVQIMVVFVVGVAGGIFGSQIVWPLLVERPLFYKYRLSQNPTYITETKEVVVQENVILQDAVEEVRKVVIAVQNGQVRGSGVVLTSDGYALTLNELLAPGAKSSFFVNGESVPFQILKRDADLNLALIKFDRRGLSTVGFFDENKMRIGQRVFLVAARVESGGAEQAIQKFSVNEGVLRTIGNKMIETTIFESSSVRGAPLFDVTGDIMGISDLDANGRVIAVSSSTIRSFTGF